MSLDHGIIQFETHCKSDAAPTSDKKHSEHVPQVARAHLTKIPLGKLDPLQRAAEAGDPEKILESNTEFVEEFPPKEVRAALRTIGGEKAASHDLL